MAYTYVGIDISKACLDVHLWPDDAAFSVARTGSGLAELTDEFGQLDRLIVAGKPKMVGIIAVAHKLLIMLNALMREKSTWKMQGAAG